jgi:O-antigen ligase
MIPSIKAPRLLPKKAIVSREVVVGTGAGRTRSKTALVWWLRAASFLAMAYLVASQALLEIPGWSSTAFIFAVLLASLLVAGQRCGIWELRFGKWIYVPAVFLSYCLLRSFSGVKDTSPWDVFVQLVSAFLGGIAVALALKLGVRFKELVYAQVASSLLQIVLILSGIGPEPPPGEDSFRYAGITGNANLLALQLTLGACMIWLLPRKAGVLPCAFAFGAVAFAIAATGSRKALLIGCFFLVLVLIQTVVLVPRKRRRLVATLAILAGGLAAFYTVPWIYENGREILAVQRTLDFEDSSFRTRTEMIQQGFQLWKQSPLFGNGLDAFGGLSGQGTYAHNNYVELLCDIGLIGTLLFYALYAQVLIRTVRAPRSLGIYCGVFILMLLLADFGYVSYKSKQAVMLLMLLTVVPTSRYAFEHQTHSQKQEGSVPPSPKSAPRRFLLRS